MKSLINGHPPSVIAPCLGRRYHNVALGSQFQHYFFRPCRGRRSHSLSTPFLILWSSRGIYPHPTGFWHCVANCDSLLGKGRKIREFGHDLCYEYHRRSRFSCLGSPYIYGRHGHRHTSLLHISHYNHRYSYGY